MITSGFSSLTTAWVAVATGVAGLLALAFIALFFAVGQPFGTLDDGCIGLAAILSGGLAWMLSPQYRSQSPLLSQVALVIAVVGALVVAAGSVLVIFGITGWFLAGVFMGAGNALIGLWLLGLSYSALSSTPWSHGLVVAGIVIGVVMALGLMAVPGMFRGTDAWDFAPRHVKYVGLAGAVGWLVLYPVWCFGWAAFSCSIDAAPAVIAQIPRRTNGIPGAAASGLA
jgi:hypothetical protein